MAKVICTLPNASSNINGVKFVTHKLGMISEDVDADTAKAFTSIHGYHHHDPKTGGIAATEGALPSTTEPALAQTIGLPAKVSPESLAAAAASLSPDDHGKLLDLLMDQVPSKPPAGAPAANTTAGGKPAASAPAGGAAPPPPSKPAATPKPAATGEQNPTF